MASFAYRKCTNLAEVFKLLREDDRAVPLAGGTDLMVGIRGGKFNVRTLLDIKDIPELKSLQEDRNGIMIGAAVSLNRVTAFSPIRENVPILAEACHCIGTYSIRNRGTLAGNICNASPAADTAAALYCLGATVNIAGLRTKKTVPIEEFFSGPGQTVLKQGELVTSVFIPRPYPAGKGVYLKGSRTGSVDLATVSVAVQSWGQEVRIALGAVAPTPVRARAVEKAINRDGETDWAAAARLVREDISPITDLRGSRDYRYHLAEVLVRRGLEQVMEVRP
jgi:CO/xanthine dehydrogenase FAD-binding subunit